MEDLHNGHEELNAGWLIGERPLAQDGG